MASRAIAAPPAGGARDARSRRDGTRSFVLALLALATLVTTLVSGGPVALAKPPAPARTPDGPTETVLRGEVVEIGCFVIGARRGEQHRQCALTCARAGEPLGILDDQTKLLFVAVPDLTAGSDPNPLLAHVAQRVEVRGVTVERGGVNGIMIRKVHPLTPPGKR